MSNSKKLFGAVAAALLAGGLLAAPSHATTTINIAFDCNVNSGQQNQYIAGGETVIYTITNCTGISDNWPNGTTYSLNTGATLISSGTVSAGAPNYAGPGTFSAISASNTYTLTLGIPATLPPGYITNAMHSSSQSGGRSGTNVNGSHMYDDVVFFVSDPTLSAGSTSGASSTTSTPVVVDPPSLWTTVRPQITDDSKSITCTSGTWSYSAAGNRPAGLALTSLTYNLLQDGKQIATKTPTTITPSYTFSVSTWTPTSIYTCDVVATQSGVTGDSKSDGDIGVAAGLKKIEHDADLVARDTYWAAVSAALSARSAALGQLDTDALQGTISVDPLKSIGIRRVRFDNIIATYRAALLAAKDARTATEALDFKNYATALTATKTALIFQGNS